MSIDEVRIEMMQEIDNEIEEAGDKGFCDGYAGRISTSGYQLACLADHAYKRGYDEGIEARKAKEKGAGQ